MREIVKKLFCDIISSVLESLGIITELWTAPEKKLQNSLTFAVLKYNVVTIIIFGLLFMLVKVPVFLFIPSEYETYWAHLWQHWSIWIPIIAVPILIVLNSFSIVILSTICDIEEEEYWHAYYRIND